MTSRDNRPFDGQRPASEAVEGQSVSAMARATMPAFAPRRLREQVRIDAALRTAMFLGLGAALVVSSLLDRPGQAQWGSVLLMGVLGVWVWVGSVNTRVTQWLPLISSVLERDPAEAEGLIAQGLSRRGLQRALRMMLYHRLALLRHHQGRFAEAAAICQTVLEYPLRQAESSRANLLLILAESRLESGDLAGAHWSLSQLHTLRLSVVEWLQRMALQTRYEVLAGQDAAALAELEQKLRMAELMPALQCGAVHVMLASAAHRSGQSMLAGWLERRAKLLMNESQIAAVWRTPSPPARP